MIIKSLKLIILIMLISSCASVPKDEIQYYLFNQQTEIKNNSEQNPNPSRQINLVKIKLPEYLSQPYLVMQLSEHQLHYARTHLWAESLQTGIAKALVADLNKNETSLRFNLNSPDKLPQESLVLEINHFYPTNNSTVILAGKYWLLNTDGNAVLSENSFKFESDLRQNGYPHAVAEMRHLVNQLSDFLITKISPVKTNH